MRQPLTVNEGTGAARKLTAKDANEKLAHRRLTVLELAARLGNVAEACRRGGIDGTSFYDWKRRFQLEGLDGLKDLLPIAKSHPMTTPPEVVARIEPGDSARFRGPGLMRSFITWPRPTLLPALPLGHSDTKELATQLPLGHSVTKGLAIDRPFPRSGRSPPTSRPSGAGIPRVAWTNQTIG